MIRTLLRSPAFAIPAAAILALGLAAVLAVFEMADAVFLSPLPYTEPERVVTAWQGSGPLRSETGALHAPLKHGGDPERLADLAQVARRLPVLQHGRSGDDLEIFES